MELVDRGKIDGTSDQSIKSAEVARLAPDMVENTAFSFPYQEASNVSRLEERRRAANPESGAPAAGLPMVQEITHAPQKAGALCVTPICTDSALQEVPWGARPMLLLEESTLSVSGSGNINRILEQIGHADAKHSTSQETHMEQLPESKNMSLVEVLSGSEQLSSELTLSHWQGVARHSLEQLSSQVPRVAGLQQTDRGTS